MRTFEMGAVIAEETWEGYRDWAEASAYWSETDTGSVCTPSIAFDPYSTTGQRAYLSLALSNSSGSTKTVTFTAPPVGAGLWVPNTVIDIVNVTIGIRYRAAVGLAGVTVTARASNSFFGGSASATVTADATWRAVTGTWGMQDDSVLALGNAMIITVPDGASGVLALDDFRLTRVDNLWREIASDVPVVALRPDWGDGFRETYRWDTAVESADDGSEYRESLRIVPRCRLEYTVIGADPQAQGRIDQFLYRYHGVVVAVPRWADAVPLASVTSSGHVINITGEITSRWFQRRQRVMLWRSDTDYETEIIDTIPNAVTITLDPNEGEVSGTFAAGTLVVPLVPARFVPDLALARPNGSITSVPLAFDVQMVQ